MSSHHVVREKQEPALLVLGLDHIDQEQLGQLLEWSPTVITTADLAEHLNSLGIKVDWVITDDTDYNLQSDIRYLAIGKDSVINTALKDLTAQAYPAVNVVTDHLNLSDYLPFADQINIVIFHQQEKIFGVVSGFSKWKPQGQQIRLLTSAGKLETTGLHQISDMVYITNADGFFTLRFEAPLLFIAEHL